MTTHYTLKRSAVWIQSYPQAFTVYFDFDYYFESCEVPCVKRKASINAISICQKPTQEDPLRNAFRRTYFPPAQDSVAKVQQNLRICKFCVEKVIGGIKVRYFLGGGSAPQKSRFFGDPATVRAKQLAGLFEKYPNVYLGK